MVTVDRGEPYIHLGCLLGLSHCRSRIMEKQNESVVVVDCDQGGVAPTTPTKVKTQMVPLAQALPATIVLVVENHHLPRGFIKERVVPRAPASATSSSSTSSIGVCDDPENADESEVQSPLRSGPLECMDALESSLPIKRGLSQFFDGKSRSFTSLKEAKEVSSAQQLSKPESPFNSKRRKLLNHTRRIPVSKSSANFKCRKDWSPPTFVRVTSSCLPRSFSHQHIISGVQNV